LKKNYHGPQGWGGDGGSGFPRSVTLVKKIALANTIGTKLFFRKLFFLIFVQKGNVGMFDWSYFDNSKLIMFNDWKVSFLRKKKSR
jgi:hypothetical protein